MKGYVSTRFNFGYRFFPKVASTSIKSALLALDGQNTLAGGDENKNAHQRASKQVRQINDCERRFIVVRDPVKRFLSAYSNRVGYHQELNKESLRRHLPVASHFLPCNPSLDQFIRHFKQYSKVSTIKHHSKPMSSWLVGNDLGFFTDVYKIEELDKFEQDLSNLCGQKVKFPHKQKGGKKITVASLNKSQLKFLLSFYRKDYELLSDYYTEEMVWDEWQLLQNNK